MLKRFNASIADNRSCCPRDRAVRADVVSDLTVDALVELLFEVAGKKELRRT